MDILGHEETDLSKGSNVEYKTTFMIIPSDCSPLLSRAFSKALSGSSPYLAAARRLLRGKNLDQWDLHMSSKVSVKEKVPLSSLRSTLKQPETMACCSRWEVFSEKYWEILRSIFWAHNVSVTPVQEIQDHHLLISFVSAQKMGKKRTITDCAGWTTHKG